MGYYRANFARWPGWAIQVQAMAGRASRAVRGFSQAVATSRVNTVVEQSLTGAPKHDLGGLTLDSLDQPPVVPNRPEHPLTAVTSPPDAKPLTPSLSPSDGER